MSVRDELRKIVLVRFSNLKRIQKILDNAGSEPDADAIFIASKNAEMEFDKTISAIIATFTGRITGEMLIRAFHNTFSLAFCGGCQGDMDSKPCPKSCEKLYIASGVATAIKKELGGCYGK